MKSDMLLDEIKQNPHFRTLPDILCREDIDHAAFTAFFRDQFEKLLAEHEGDNEGLKEESHHYILPAIAVYQTLQRYTPNALLLFREMWLNGAKLGASFLQEKAQDDDFLKGWIPSVTPKKTETDAFLFRIDHTSDMIDPAVSAAFCSFFPVQNGPYFPTRTIVEL